MEKKLVCLITFTVLIGLLCTSLSGLRVKANGIIYIRADGPIDPSTAPVQRDGDIYTFTDNVYDSIVLLRSDIVVDGASYTLQGTGSGTGIDASAISAISNVTIKKMEIKGFTIGIILSSSFESTISGNTITNNRDGILVGGLGQFGSFSNIFSGNTITNNENGIIFEGYVADNIISGNTITSNSNYGIALITFAPLHSPTEENIISGNIITNNGNGIYLSESSNNSIYHNDFVNNSDQVYTINSVNVWDDGYPSGGNYWSDYIGVDTDGDGIGDTPYIIEEDNQDNYPFVPISAYMYYLSCDDR